MLHILIIVPKLRFYGVLFRSVLRQVVSALRRERYGYLLAHAHLGRKRCSCGRLAGNRECYLFLLSFLRRDNGPDSCSARKWCGPWHALLHRCLSRLTLFPCTTSVGGPRAVFMMLTNKIGEGQKSIWFQHYFLCSFVWVLLYCCTEFLQDPNLNPGVHIVCVDHGVRDDASVFREKYTCPAQQSSIATG